MDNLTEEIYIPLFEYFYRLEFLLNKLLGKVPTKALKHSFENYDKLSFVIDYIKNKENIDTSLLEDIIKEKENNYISYLDSLLNQDKDKIKDLFRQTFKNNLLAIANPSNKESFTNELNFCIENLYNTYIISNIEPRLSDDEFNKIELEALREAISYLNNQLAIISLKLLSESDPIMVAETEYEYNVYKTFYDIYLKELENEENNKQEKSM